MKKVEGIGGGKERNKKRKEEENKNQPKKECKKKGKMTQTFVQSHGFPGARNQHGISDESIKAMGSKQQQQQKMKESSAKR
jgi:hypothetical protein